MTLLWEEARVGLSQSQLWLTIYSEYFTRRKWFYCVFMPNYYDLSVPLLFTEWYNLRHT